MNIHIRNKWNCCFETKRNLFSASHLPFLFSAILSKMNAFFLILVFVALMCVSLVEAADPDIGGIFSGVGGLLGSIGGLAGAGGKKK